VGRAPKAASSPGWPAPGRRSLRPLLVSAKDVRVGRSSVPAGQERHRRSESSKDAGHRVPGPQRLCSPRQGYGKARGGARPLEGGEDAPQEARCLLRELVLALVEQTLSVWALGSGDLGGELAQVQHVAAVLGTVLASEVEHFVKRHGVKVNRRCHEVELDDVLARGHRP
jgi:hypothetical protein